MGEHDDVVRVRDDFEALRRRPAMYLPRKCITALSAFIIGVDFGTGLESNPFPIPRDFHDWVAYRLHFYEPTSGWANMLFTRYGDSMEGVEGFFRLLDEYKTRQPRVIAVLVGCDQRYTRYFLSQKEERTYPDRIYLTIYNLEDPGVFLSADGEDCPPFQSYLPSRERFEKEFGPWLANLEILDREGYDAWAAQSVTADDLWPKRD